MVECCGLIICSHFLEFLGGSGIGIDMVFGIFDGKWVYKIIDWQYLAHFL